MMCQHSREYETCEFGCTLRKKEELKIENDKLKKRLKTTTRYLEVRTRPQRPFTIPRLVDTIIEQNNQLLKEKS